MVGVARLPDAEQQNGAVIQSLRGALDEREGRRLADGDAIAGDVEGPAGVAGDELQRMESVRASSDRANRRRRPPPHR